MNPITAQSTPDYDDWGWDNYWTCADWIAWHKALKSAYGLPQANQKFIQAYHRATFGAASYDCRTFNKAFRDYARENGFLNALYEGVGAIMNPVGNVIDVGSNVVDAAVSASSIIKKLIPLAVIAAFIIGIVYFSKKAQIL